MSADEAKKIVDGTFELVIRTILQKTKSGKNLSASDIKALTELRQGLQEPSSGDEKDWEKEYRRYKALLAELEYEQQRGRLLPREDVTRAWCNRYTHVKRHLLLWSKRLPGRLAGMDERQMGQALEEEEYQPLKFAQVKWPELGKEDPDRLRRIEEEAHYECVACLGMILDHHKAGMLQAGE